MAITKTFNKSSALWSKAEAQTIVKTHVLKASFNMIAEWAIAPKSLL